MTTITLPEALPLTGDAEFDRILTDCITTLETKGAEYTGGSVDRLNNFRSIGEEIELPMEKVWYTYFNKHLRALQSYIKNGCVVKSNEPIDGRIMDLITYLLLFYKMVKEIERNRLLAQINERRQSEKKQEDDEILNLVDNIEESRG